MPLATHPRGHGAGGALINPIDEILPNAFGQGIGLHHRHFTVAQFGPPPKLALQVRSDPAQRGVALPDGRSDQGRIGFGHAVVDEQCSQDGREAQGASIGIA